MIIGARASTSSTNVRTATGSSLGSQYYLQSDATVAILLP